MMPSPVQHAMIAALADEKHVQEQAERYNNRRTLLSAALVAVGFRIEHSKAGLYIWCTKGEDGYKTVDWFASFGILVTPGSFYGSDNFIRIALTATDENIAKVVARIKS
jgi:aspartate/methionine/tyrosine aminotransferase